MTYWKCFFLRKVLITYWWLLISVASCSTSVEFCLIVKLRFSLWYLRFSDTRIFFLNWNLALMEATCTHSLPLIRKIKKKEWGGKKIVLSIFHRLSQMYSEHTTSNCVPFHAALFLISPTKGTANLSEDWKFFQLDILVQVHPLDGEGSRVMLIGSHLSKWVILELLKKEFLHRNNCLKAEYQRIMDQKVWERRLHFNSKFFYSRENVKMIFNLQQNSHKKSTTQGFVEGLSAKHFEFTEISKRGEFSYLKLSNT